MVDPWPTHGLPLVDSWSTHGRPMADPWSTHGRPMVDPRATHGRPMVDLWSTPGRPLVDPWSSIPLHLSADCAELKKLQTRRGPSLAKGQTRACLLAEEYQRTLPLAKQYRPLRESGIAGGHLLCYPGCWLITSTMDQHHKWWCHTV